MDEAAFAQLDQAWAVISSVSVSSVNFQVVAQPAQAGVSSQTVQAQG